VSGSRQRQRGGRSDLDPRSTAVCFPVRVTVSMLFIEENSRHATVGASALFTHENFDA